MQLLFIQMDMGYLCSQSKQATDASINGCTVVKFRQMVTHTYHI